MLNLCLGVNAGSPKQVKLDLHGDGVSILLKVIR